MSIGKKRTESHIIGETGIDILKQHLPAEWVIREYHPDYGIDLAVEIFTRGEKCVTKGAHLFIQVKTSYQFDRHIQSIPNRSNVEIPARPVEDKKYKMEVIKYTLDTDFLYTVERMGSGVPVLLCLVEIKTKEVFFVCLSDYIEKILVNERDYTLQKTKIVYIPTENIINESNLDILEWYAKRPRFYALFNKIHYQNSELEYVSQYDISKYIEHFIRIIRRFDVWEEPLFIPWMEQIDEEINYYLKHGITQHEDDIVKNRQESGEDVDAEIWEATYCDCNKEVSFREAQRVQGLHRLWKELSELGNFFEDVYKEAFLPTAQWNALK